MVFQMTFAIITPALICGAFADRMKFSALLWFLSLWFLLVYVPVAHWVWGGGFLAQMGLKDFAGGTVVEINSGVAGLVAAILLGKRKGYPQEAMIPHNLVLSVTGASLLWVGRQAPAHAHVAEVVDDAAEDVPAQRVPAAHRGIVRCSENRPR